MNNLVGSANAATIADAFRHYEKREYRKAYLIAIDLARQDHHEAQYAVGTMYLHGQGIRSNLKKAIFWLERAAEAGHAGALATIYSVYSPFSKFEPNPKKALFWTSEALNRGHGTGYLQMGFLTYYGWGVTKDHFKAYEHYRKAAQLGVAGAYLNISLMHASGDIGFIDLTKSYAWAMLAENNNIDVKEHLKKLKAKMNESEIGNAVKYFEQCLSRDLKICR